MASERHDTQSLEEDEYERPRPRRRFRGLHWRHASQTYTPPPLQQPPPPQISPPLQLSFNLGESGFEGLMPGSSPTMSPTVTTLRNSALRDPDSPNSVASYSTMSKSFGDELSKVFNIDEDPLVEELESSVREKNQRLSMQTSELEKLSQRIKEAEERLRRVEEENEESSLGRPTPPVSPLLSQPSNDNPLNSEGRLESDKKSMIEEERGESV